MTQEKNTQAFACREERALNWRNKDIYFLLDLVCSLVFVEQAVTKLWIYFFYDFEHFFFGPGILSLKMLAT